MSATYGASGSIVIPAAELTRIEEIADYADEHAMPIPEAIVSLVNRSLSLPDPEPSFDDKLHELQAAIQAATDRAGWAPAGGEVAGAVVDLGRAVNALVSTMRRELRRGVE